MNGKLFFEAAFELWKSDGTEEGTMRVKAAAPGDFLSPSRLVNVNGALFFSAHEQATGYELWKSDGTDAGTVLVKDIRASANGSSLAHLTNINGTLFFTANDFVNGEELWKSDGTTGGTVLVKDINPVAKANSYPTYLTNVNGTVFFRANDGTNGYELWKSDGTEDGTVLVKNISAGAFDSLLYPYTNLLNVNGTLFFSAHTGTSGLELWKSDGSAAGTMMVKDIDATPQFSSYPDSFTNVNGTLFFSANDGVNGFEVWKSDGTAAGTVLVKDIREGALDSVGDYSYLTNANGTLFFSADDGIRGRELWSVRETNSVPSFVIGADQTGPLVNDEAGAISITNWATNRSAGTIDEAGQTLTFNLLVPAAQQGLFSVMPAIDAMTGNLTFTPKPNAKGAVTVSVTLRDNGGGTGETSQPQSFTIDIAKPHPWHNSDPRPFGHLDVNGKDGVTVLDAVMVINYLNSAPPAGPGDVPASAFALPPGLPAPGYIDVAISGLNANLISTLDALQIINYLNTPSGEGESKGRSASPAPSAMPGRENSLDNLLALLAVDVATQPGVRQCFLATNEMTDSAYGNLLTLQCQGAKVAKPQRPAQPSFLCAFASLASLRLKSGRWEPLNSR